MIRLPSDQMPFSVDVITSRKIAVGLMLLGLVSYPLSASESNETDEKLAEDTPIEKVQVLANYRLKLSLNTTASKATIWELWSNIEKWHLYDVIVESVELEGDASFAQGAVGYVDTTQGPRTRFTLTEVNDGVSFTEKLHLPLGQSILLKRYFEPAPQAADGEPSVTRFTHEVVFKGRLKSLIYLIAGKTFKKEMPLVMSRLKEVAENAELTQPNSK